MFSSSRYIKTIKQDQISDVLAQTDLVVSDFSSVIFDLMYRIKPYVIYIHDSEDPNLNILYTDDYYFLIEKLKNGTIPFENLYFNIREAVDKIIYYIHNKFHLEKELEIFYDSFSFKKGNIKNVKIKLINFIII